MHEQLTSRVLSLAATLKPGEAVVFHDFIVCRAKAGTLRFAAAENGMNAGWYRGEFAELVAGHIEMLADWSRRGYFAGRSLGNIKATLGRPRPLLITGVGRQMPSFTNRGSVAA